MTRIFPIRPLTPSHAGRGPGFLVTLLFVAFLILAGSSSPVTVSAQTDDNPVRTTPIDGEIPQRWPRSVIATFPVAIDPDASSLKLVDINGEEVQGTQLVFPADGTSISLNLPSDMQDGVYSMVWDATPADGGDPIIGYSSFSVGNPEDAAIITVPSTAGTGDGPPQWLQVGARWSALIGIIAAISTWPVWTVIVRPSLRPIWRRGPRIVAAMQQFAFIAFSLAFLGSLFELVVRSQAMPDGTWLDKLMNTVGNTDWGTWWLVRMFLLIFLGIGLALAAWWYPSRRPWRMVAAWLLSLLAPLTLSLTSHATENSVGREAAVATDYLHLLAAGLWGGAVVIVATVLLPSLKGVDANARRDAISRLATRFGGLTLIAWAILIITGAYSTHLFVGNWTAMTETEYGRALLAKLVLSAVAIALVAAGIIAIRRRASNGGQLRWILLAQGAVVLAILLAVGQMNTTPPARDVLLDRSTQTTTTVGFPGRESLYLVAPQRAGVNHLRLEIPGDYLPNDAEAYVDISSPDHPELGTKTIQMYRVPGNAFEHHGTEFALTGTWEMTLRLVEPGFQDLSYTVTQHFGEETPSVDLPANPWRFNPLGGTAGLVLIVVGVAGIVIAILANGPTRKEAGGLGAAALALAAVLLVQAQYDPILAVADDQGAINPNDLAMVARGEQVYDTYCMNCHGPELRGDGPLNENLNPPAADFAAPHTFVHSDEDFIYWIKNGKQGTAMPGFDAQLTDQEMRDVVAFIYNWQANYDGSDPENASAEPTACEVAPLEYAEVREIFHHGLMPEIRRGGPLINASDQTVDGDTANDVMWTVEQVVACTNADQTLSRLRLFTNHLLMELFPAGMDQRLTMATTSQPQPLAPEERVSIEDVQSITRLADGRIAVTVIFNDPAGIGVVPGAGVITQVTFVMIEQDDAWIVDEIR